MHRTFLVSLLLVACDGGKGADPAETDETEAVETDSDVLDTDDGVSVDGTTAGVACGIDVDVYNDDESVELNATYRWTCTETERQLQANGVPDHEVGTFPNPGNPNTIGAVNVSATFPLAPVLAESATSRRIPGYALNGVKLDPGTAGTCNDAGDDCDLGPGGTGSWRIEALGQSSFDFGTDENNAHVQPTGDYHYHGIPERLVTARQVADRMTLVAWASDGFPIYARLGHRDPADPTSPLVSLTSSYALKATPDANRPSTSIYPMGAFTQDYEYVEGAGDLDACNGRTGVTPEFPAGIYHYMLTDTYPFIQRCVNGVAEAEAGPGGGPPP